MESRSGHDDLTSVDELLAYARSQIIRLHPVEALAATQDGSILIDIRPVEQRDRDGILPDAHEISRNVLEWRLDPQCEHRDPTVARLDRRVILICDEGYQSSLAAATLRRFGLDATDVIGGVQAWREQGLQLTNGPEPQLTGSPSPNYRRQDTDTSPPVEPADVAGRKGSSQATN